jgi:hypothetical protein
MSTPETTEDEPAVSISTLRQQVTELHADIARQLAGARKERDRVHQRIRNLVAEEAEAARAVKALTPKAKT